MIKYCQLELPLQRKNCEGRTIKQTSEEYIDCNGRKRTMYITELGARPKIKVKGYVGK